MLALHKALERHSGLLIFGILFVASLGGLAQIIPTFFDRELGTAAAATQPYTPLELVGRDLYIRESCALCHSQQIRPLLAEVKRYGPPSMPGEFVYDRPFLWGSKRTGPDLHRIGGKYSDAWHELHLLDPRAVVPSSIMPAYPWLASRPADPGGSVADRMRALQKLGHPYSAQDIQGAADALAGKTEMDAMIAYLQSLGRRP